MLRKIFINKFSICIFLLLHWLLVGWKYSEPKYCRLSDKITNKYNKELKEQKGLFLIGSGGAFMYDIKKIGLSYISLSKLTVDEARKLFVEVEEGYLKRYNENEEIRPYLHNFPFTIENLELMIIFDEKRNDLSNGYIAGMYIANKKLYFKGYDYHTNELYTIHSEPYSTSIEIVQCSHSPCAAY